MSCGNANLVISFVESAVKVRPTQVNLRKSKGKFNHIRCRLTQEAGQYIYDNHRPGEPVYILSDGKELGRFYIPDDEKSVEVTEKSAFLDLRDEIQVLDETIIDKTFGGTNNLGDVVAWLVNASIEDQEYGVITGHEFTSPEDVDVETFTNYLKDEILGTRILSYGAFYTDPLFDLLGAERFDLDYQNVSVLDALTDLMEKVGLSLFSKGTGTIWIGNEDHSKNVFSAGFGENTLNITGMSLPQNVSKIKEVRIIGGTGVNLTEPRNDPEKDRGFQRFFALLQNGNIPDGEGKKIKIEVPEIKQPQTLSNIAKRVYLKETANESNGSVTVEMFSSIEHSGVKNFKDVTVGDAVFIEDSDFCRRRNIPSGLYNISGIHHKINNRVGWNTTLDIAQVPLLDNVSVYTSQMSEDELGNDTALQQNGWVRKADNFFS